MISCICNEINVLFDLCKVIIGVHTEIHYVTIEVKHTFSFHILVQQFFTNGFSLVSVMFLLYGFCKTECL